jgi:hypothetical protein
VAPVFFLSSRELVCWRHFLEGRVYGNGACVSRELKQNSEIIPLDKTVYIAILTI